MTSATRPVVALTLGDPAGIGPELIAKLLVQTDLHQMADNALQIAVRMGLSRLQRRPSPVDPTPA